MKQITNFQTEMITKRVKEEIKMLGKEPLLVFLSGSRLNNIGVAGKSDFDLFVIVKPTVHELLNGKLLYSKHLSMGTIEDEGNNVPVDAKVFSLIKFYQILKKTNFNTLELLVEEPLYCSDEKLLNLLKANFSLFCQLDFNGMVSSVKGYAKANIRRLEKTERSKREFKDTQQVLKGEDYITQILENGYIENVDFKGRIVDRMKNDEIYKRALNEDDLIKYNNYVISKSEAKNVRNPIFNYAKFNEDNDERLTKFEKDLFDLIVDIAKPE